MYHWDRNQLTHHTGRHAREGKSFPSPSHEGTGGKAEGQVHSFLPLALDRVNGFHTPAALPPGNNPKTH